MKGLAECPCAAPPLVLRFGTQRVCRFAASLSGRTRADGATGEAFGRARGSPQGGEGRSTGARCPVGSDQHGCTEGKIRPKSRVKQITVYSNERQILRVPKEEEASRQKQHLLLQKKKKPKQVRLCKVFYTGKPLLSFTVVSTSKWSLFLGHVATTKVPLEPRGTYRHKTCKPFNMHNVL